MSGTPCIELVRRATRAGALRRGLWRLRPSLGLDAGRQTLAASWIAALLLTASPLGSVQEQVQDFLWIWETLRTEIYDEALVERFLSESQRQAMLQTVRVAGSPQELAAQVNTLLDSMQVSHNRLFTDADIEYFLFHSMFRTRDVATPRVHHMGVQTEAVEDGFVLRAVWDGLPAHGAGLRRGDVISLADGTPFHPLESFRDGEPATLVVRRGEERFDVVVTPVYEGVNASLLRALRSSVRLQELNGFTVGFVHLWSGTCPEMLQAFRRIIVEELATADGILLDLRDGWGGAWYEYLDPFFEDRRDFYRFTVGRRGESRTQEPEAVESHPWFAGPVVVIVNGGTRSGKEALAYQFKKSRRAVLVGTPTAGAFTGGSTFFRGPYALYVPYNGPVLLDGTMIEGIGVQPDIVVADSLEASPGGDPPLERALQAMDALLLEIR